MTALGASFQGPVAGLLTSRAVAEMPPESALILDNFIAENDQVVLRKGASLRINLAPDTVETLAPFNVATGSKLFAFAGSVCYEIGTNGSSTVEFTGLTNARWQFTQFATSAVDTLLLVNGYDSMRQWYSGAWTTVTTVGSGGSTFNTNTFNLVCAYNQRLFFGLRDTLNFVYLPAGSIAGSTAARFQLNQIFPLGGVLAAIDTWSVDSGTGPDDYIVFVTTAGEAAVFKGTDPADATKWTRVGTYNIGPPIGTRCTAKIAGDLWVLTRNGIVSLTRVMRSGRISSRDLISFPFQPNYKKSVELSFNDFGWQVQPFLDAGLVLVSCNSETSIGHQYVLCVSSGAWSRFVGWSAKCMTVFGNQLVVSDGTKVVNALTGAADFGIPIEGRILTAYNFLGQRTKRKQVNMVKPVFRSNGNFAYQLGLCPDYRVTEYTTTIGALAAAVPLWNQSYWNQVTWSSGLNILTNWSHVPNQDAYCHALALQVRSSTAQPALLGLDYLYEIGALF